MTEGVQLVRLENTVKITSYQRDCLKEGDVSPGGNSVAKMLVSKEEDS